jgi:hypothetical protein
VRLNFPESTGFATKQVLESDFEPKTEAMMLEQVLA